jgi:hypothetical protein
MSVRRDEEGRHPPTASKMKFRHNEEGENPPCASKKVCDVARRWSPPHHVVSPVGKGRLLSINQNEKKKYAYLVRPDPVLSRALASTVALRRRAGVFVSVPSSWSWLDTSSVVVEVAWGW